MSPTSKAALLFTKRVQILMGRIEGTQIGCPRLPRLSPHQRTKLPPVPRWLQLVSPMAPCPRSSAYSRFPVPISSRDSSSPLSHTGDHGLASSVPHQTPPR